MSPNCAVFLALLLDKYSYWKKHAEEKGEGFDGWFFKSQEEIEKEISLSKDEQRTVRRYLVGHGLLNEKEERYLGGRKVLFQLDFNRISKLLNDFHKPENSTCTSQKIQHVQVEKVSETSTCILLEEREKEQIFQNIKDAPVLQEIAAAKPIPIKQELPPSPKSIVRAWKAQFPVQLSWQQRRQHLEELFATLKSYSYSEEDLYPGFEAEVTAPWLPKKTSKGSEHMILKTKEDYELAIANLSPTIKISEVKRIHAKSDSAPKNGEISIDTAIEMSIDDDEMEKMMAEYKRLTEDVDNG
jgi:hypothetical protein